MIANKSTKKRVKIVECKQHNKKVVLTNFNWMVTTQKFSYKIKSWKHDSLTPYGISLLSNFHYWRFDGPGWKINGEVDDSRRLNTSLRARSLFDGVTRAKGDPIAWGGCSLLLLASLAINGELTRGPVYCKEKVRSSCELVLLRITSTLITFPKDLQFSSV